MKKFYMSAAVCLFLWCLFFSIPSANAALFNVDFNDSVGPHWTGLVDTTTNTLSINTWIENDGFPALWTPAGLPMIWNAVNSSGASFDVPDNWNGVIGSNWGFLSPVLLSSMSFNEGTWTGNPIKPGWGAYHDGSSIQTNFDNTYLPVWPRFTNSGWQVTAESVQVTAAPAVPIPGAVLLLGSGLASPLVKRDGCILSYKIDRCYKKGTVSQ